MNSRIHHFRPQCIAFNQTALRHLLPECIVPRTTRGCHTVEPFLMQLVKVCNCDILILNLVEFFFYLYLLEIKKRLPDMEYFENDLSGS